MNAIAQANADSDLYRTMKSGAIEMKNPFLYSLGVNMGSISPHVTSSVSKLLPSQSIVEFPVPRSGLWKGVRMKFVQNNVNQTVKLTAPWAPLRMFDAVELRTRSSLIQRLTRADFVEYLNQQSLPASYLLAGEQYFDAAASRTMKPKEEWVVPIPFACHDRLNNCHDTKITEPLIIRVISSNHNYIFVEAPDLAKVTLNLAMNFEFITLDDQMLAEFKSGITSKGERGAARLMWNSVVESVKPGIAINSDITNGRFITEHEIKTRYPVFKVCIDVLHDKLYKRTPVVGGAGVPTIKTIELVASGVPIGTWSAAELRLNSVSGAHTLAQTYNTKANQVEAYEINFALTDVKSDQTGFLSFRHLTDARWRITWDSYFPFENAVGQGGVVVEFNNLYHLTEAVEPTDGNITVTTLS
jgi:hypothetical protein